MPAIESNPVDRVYDLADAGARALFEDWAAAQAYFGYEAGDPLLLERDGAGYTDACVHAAWMGFVLGRPKSETAAPGLTPSTPEKRGPNEVMMFEKTETLAESIASDVVTFGFLLLCMGISIAYGSTGWTFLTVTMFLLSLSVKLPGGVRSRWVKLHTKREAVEWATALPADPEPRPTSNGAHK